MAKFVKFPEGPYTVRRDVPKKNKAGIIEKDEQGNKVIETKAGDASVEPAADSVDGQMLAYLRDKYGNNPVDQYEVMTELNDHQKDDTVLSKPEDRVRPLSQIYSWRVADWYNSGFIDRATAKALAPAMKQPGKIAQLEARVRYLEARLHEAGIQYNEAA